MAKEDIAVKQYLNVRERFADIFNANVFCGRQVIKPDELSEVSSESDIITEGSKVIFKGGNVNITEQAKRALWRYRDIVMRWHGITLMLLACEVQGRVNYAMPVRGMLYDALSYTDQMSSVWEQLGEEEKHGIDGAEFFSRFRREDRLYPVITLVFYYGEKPWDGSLELYDMFDFENAEDKEAVKKFVSNYAVNLIDVSGISDLSVYHSDLKEVLGMVMCRESRDELLKYANEHREFFKSVDYETINALGAMIHGGELYARMLKNNNEEECNMCKALQDLWDDGVKTGEARGEERGMKLGEKRGAVAMLKELGMSDDVIIDMVQKKYGTTLEEVTKYLYAVNSN